MLGSAVPSSFGPMPGRALRGAGLRSRGQHSCTRTGAPRSVHRGAPIQKLREGCGGSFTAAGWCSAIGGGARAHYASGPRRVWREQPLEERQLGELGRLQGGGRREPVPGRDAGAPLHPRPLRGEGPRQEGVPPEAGRLHRGLPGADHRPEGRRQRGGAPRRRGRQLQPVRDPAGAPAGAAREGEAGGGPGGAGRGHGPALHPRGGRGRGPGEAGLRDQAHREAVRREDPVLPRGGEGPAALPADGGPAERRPRRAAHLRPRAGGARGPAGGGGAAGGEGPPPPPPRPRPRRPRRPWRPRGGRPRPRARRRLHRGPRARGGPPRWGPRSRRGPRGRARPRRQEEQARQPGEFLLHRAGGRDFAAAPRSVDARDRAAP
mmetsp:Transcript_71630/g.202216  ORF Transcript_71630/g.202216 Transcript_71630/m.202216 type:complete len:377 (+) Transcript_71630:1144-2274(+)